MPSPRASWGKPARGSVWQNLTSIEPRVTDDRANVPLLARDGSGRLHLLVPSSADDRLLSLDPQSGKKNWQIETGGPVRYAPSILDGVAYFGADDGRVRAVRLSDGKRMWEQTVGPGYREIVGNGRLISPHPIRTSVLVQHGKVFAHAGLFPSQGVYSVAFDRNGELVWRRKIESSSQGYLLATGKNRVYVPTGRSVPYALDSADGRKLFDLPSPGGSFCMLTPDLFFTGPGNASSVESYTEKGRARMLSFKARHVAAGGGRIWTANGSRIACHDLAKVAEGQQTTLWQLESKSQNGMLVTGEPQNLRLFAAGEGSVEFVNADTGELIQSLAVPRDYGEVINLAVSAKGEGGEEVLVATTDRGHLLAWHPSRTGTPGTDLKKAAPARAPVVHSPGVPADDSARPKQSLVDSLARATERLQSASGFGLVEGRNPRAAIEQLVSTTKLQLVGLARNEEQARSLREHFRSRQLYGLRVIIKRLEGDRFPFESNLFNLVVQCPESSFLAEDQLLPLVCEGGVLMHSDGRIRSKPFREGLGSWRHQYADPSNLADSGDPEVGNAAAFKLKWFGGVGPSRMPDRHFRGPAPLSAGPAMIVQADGVLIGVDPANGTERWQYQLPEKSMRYVTPYDGGYVCLTENGEQVYAACNERVLLLDALKGKLLKSLPVDVGERRWGYLAQGKEELVLTRMKPSAPRIATDRKTQRTFVDQDYRSERPLVCSREILVTGTDFGSKWQRESLGLIPHGGISVDFEEGRVVLVEARSQSCLEHSTDRIPLALLMEDAFLVCLDLDNGETLWEKKLVWPEAKNVLYSQLTPEGILLTSSESLSGKARYHFRMLSHSTGQPVWSLQHDHVKGGLYHGEQVHHPLVLRQNDGVCRLMAEPFCYELKTGKKTLPSGMQKDWTLRRPGHSCGTLSGCGNCLFFRASFPTVLNMNSKQSNPFTALAPSRPGCWINIIPAGGRLLIPEASASCVCKYSLQTSLCFEPVAEAELDSEISILPDVLPKNLPSPK
ncbi:MAG: PQQ-binding-like beta-propeller repeat protein [Planctomycetota bacterium]|nr:PQQ-binding-like beta-propeller repeat protein [Planctomycetota bacterium]